jgi:hypothetical protein
MRAFFRIIQLQTRCSRLGQAKHQREKARLSVIYLPHGTGSMGSTRGHHAACMFLVQAAVIVTSWANFLHQVRGEHVFGSKSLAIVTQCSESGLRDSFLWVRLSHYDVAGSSLTVLWWHCPFCRLLSCLLMSGPFCSELCDPLLQRVQAAAVLCLAYKLSDKRPKSLQTTRGNPQTRHSNKPKVSRAALHNSERNRADDENHEAAIQVNEIELLSLDPYATATGPFNRDNGSELQALH